MNFCEFGIKLSDAQNLISYRLMAFTLSLLVCWLSRLNFFQVSQPRLFCFSYYGCSFQTYLNLWKQIMSCSDLKQKLINPAVILREKNQY